jgi:hypothetical protein
MNTIRFCRRTVYRWMWLWLVTGILHPALGARLVDETFPVLKTRTGSYTNVTVTTRAENYIFILHASGMTSLKVAELPVEVRRQLGYAVTEVPSNTPTNAVTSVSAREQANTHLNSNASEAGWGANAPVLKLSSEIILTFLVIGLLVHLFISYCFSQICLKANGTRNLLVWVPVLQFIPLFHAAGMSGAWVLALFVPLLNIVAWAIWALNITKALGKGMWVAVLLMIPTVNLVALLYLAFSSNESDPGPPKKFHATALQTA